MRVDRVAALLKSGELAARARQAGSLQALLAEFGLNHSDWEMHRKRCLRRGTPPATWQSLIGETAPIATGPIVDAVDEFMHEEQTDPGMSLLEPHAERWIDPPQPEDNIPPGHVLRGISTQVREDGTVVSRWIKTRKSEEDRYEALLAAMAGIGDAWRGLAEPTTAPTVHDADLLCVVPLGDPHLGMYAWAQETGNDFDLVIAERNMVAAVDHLIGLAPPAEQALLVNLGDFFHTDNSSNVTMRSHNSLDVDTRWAKVLSVGIRTMRRCIDRMLEKHRFVRVVCAIGNHDDHSSVMLALALSQYYEREPRVEIDTSPAKFHWLRFGANLIGITHGDTVKADKLPGVMAHDRAQDWGETEHRYWLCGHVHHESVKEYPGVTVETFRTLAGRDAWHHAAGYRSQRDLRLDVHHRRWGRMQRHIVGINQICAA